ncbi:MAG: 16S rRNA (guanine(966)-N(2))-methyltransferase RsmD [Clostridiales bacterium]|nr:16S rRNA (guanine(966)-N(2))-methyltransferase RsmD [Clostridiales bacterium]MDY3745546.1 16S rRNA (guanine(966)-N(2))-methyltransferase RsmD [Lachnospiraceae bacterium]
MRVIAGTARRLPLKTIEGLETRPTTDRIKETLFNMLGFDLADALFVDLFSGSGAIGIEALSRGAKKAWFVERNPKACACISENLKTTKLEEKACVMMTDAVSAVIQLSGMKKPVDFIFMDPPYRHDLEKDVLVALKDSPLVDTYTTIIVEADLTTDFSYAESLGFSIKKEKRYKTNKHVFLIKSES